MKGNSHAPRPNTDVVNEPEDNSPNLTTPSWFGRLKAGAIASRTARDGVWSIVLRLASKGLGFLITIVLARVLGADGYGVYAYAFALVTLLSMPAQAGLPALVIRETAAGMAREDPARVRGVWVWSGRAVAVLSIVLVLIAGIIHFIWNEGRIEGESWTLVWALILVPFAALGNMRGAALRGLHQIVAGQLPEFVFRPGLLLLFIGGVIIVSTTQITPPVAMALHVAAAAIAFCAGGWMLWIQTPPSVRGIAPRYETKKWVASAVPLALVAGMLTINRQADILMLGIFSPPDQVGVYRVSVQVATLASFGLQAMNMVVAPRFANLYAKGEMDRLQQLVRKSARVVLVISLVSTIVFVLFGRPVLEVIFGSAYVASYLPLIILLFGQMVNSLAGSVGFLLNMTGFEKETARGMAAAAGINIVLNLILIPIWGTVGAATTTAISMLAWNFLLWYAVRKHLGINSLAF